MLVRVKRSGTTHRLLPADLIGRGAEGPVYRNGTRCFKLHDTPLTDRAAEVTELLTRLGRKLPGFAWPDDLLVDPNTNDTVGFTLPFVPGETLEAALDARATAAWPVETKAGLALAAATAVTHVHALPGPTMILGDVVKPANFMVDGSSGTFIDTGSVTVFGFRTTAGALADWVNPLSTPGYMPAEVLKNPKALPSHSADRFALAVTLFELLFGWHPVEPKPAPAAFGLTLDELVEQGVFHRWVQHPTFEPPTYDPVTLPAEVDALFRTAFLGRPDQRPTAEEWVTALTRWQAKLAQPGQQLLRRMQAIGRAVRFADRAVSVVVLAAALVLAGRLLRDHWDDVRALAGPQPLPAVTAGPPAYRELFKCSAPKSARNT